MTLDRAIDELQLLASTMREGASHRSVIEKLTRMALQSSELELVTLAERLFLDVDLAAEEAEALGLLLAGWCESHADHAMAEEWLKRVIDVSPGCREGLERLASLYQRTDRLDDLARLLGEWAIHESDTAVRRSVLMALAGLLARALDEPARALATWNSVLEISPADETALGAIARLQRELADWGGLVETLERQMHLAEDLNRRNAIKFEVAETLERLEKLDRAEACYREILEDDTGDERTFGALVRIHEKLGNRSALQEVLLAQQLAAARRAPAVPRFGGGPSIASPAVAGPIETSKRLAMASADGIAATDSRVPERYFRTDIDGVDLSRAPDVTIQVKRDYCCSVRIDSERGSGLSAAILPEDMQELARRKVTVLAIGERLMVVRPEIHLKVDPEDHTSESAEVDFWAPEPGPCGLTLDLRVDGNSLKQLNYRFIAVERAQGASTDDSFTDSGPIASNELLGCCRPVDLNVFISGSYPNWHITVSNLLDQPANFILKDATMQVLARKRLAFLYSYSKSLPHTRSLDLDRSATQCFLKDLEALGDDLFYTLFREQPDQQRKAVGAMLKRTCAERQGLRIQIHSGGLHLPWSYLHDGKGAIGLRHQVECIPIGVESPGVPLLLPSAPGMTCGLSDLFRNEEYDDTGVGCVRAQSEHLANLLDGRGALDLCSDERRLIDLLRQGSPHLLYLYCHGRQNDGRNQLWLTSSAKSISGPILDKVPESAWAHAPLVVAAACEGGSMDPMTATGLMGCFAGKGVRGFVSADGKVPAVFAAHFMNQFFDGLLNNREPVGDILYRLRNEFLDNHNNPWGLLFVQYCRSEVGVRAR